MKILIINNLFFPYNKGGAEKIAELQANNYKKEGHQVIILSTKDRKQEADLNKDYKIYYFNSAYFNLNKRNILWRLFWHFLQFFSLNKRKFIKIIKKEKPDLIITHNVLGLGWNIIKVIKKFKIKHEHRLHDIQLLHPSGLMYFGKENIIDSNLAKIYQFLLKDIFKNVDTVVSPSKWLLNLHKEKGFFINSNLKIENLLNNNKNNIIWPKKIINFVFVGQLEKHKGILFLLDFIKNNKHLSLAIIGDGSLNNYIKDKIENEKINNVKLIGRLNKNELLTEIKKKDCLILPSICYENSPSVIFEAASIGLPIIASEIGGIIELKEKYNIKLFKVADYKSLSNLIFSYNDASSYQPADQK